MKHRPDCELQLANDFGPDVDSEIASCTCGGNCAGHIGITCDRETALERFWSLAQDEAAEQEEN